jgi:hypothetical protein
MALRTGMTEMKDVYSILVGDREEYSFIGIWKAKLQWI